MTGTTAVTTRLVASIVGVILGGGLVTVFGRFLWLGLFNLGRLGSLLDGAIGSVGGDFFVGHREVRL